jgi:F-type H+-transporting ATPase subunit a
MMNLLFAAGDDPLDHVVQHPLITRELDLGFLTPEGVITVMSDHISMLILAGVVLVTLFPLLVRMSRSNEGLGKMVPRGFATFIEATCEFLREEVARPVLGKHTDTFVKYIWSVFFFVLTVNLLGMLPIAALTKWLFGVQIGGTGTANIWTTGALALLTLVMMVVNGLRIGGLDYLKHFNPGPALMAPLLVPIEIIGTLTKPIALAVRLFANMMAGHLILAVLLSFIFSAGKMIGSLGGTALGVGVIIAAIAGSVAITFLELLVAFIQAFIFSFLTAVFIGLSVNVSHDEEHAH